MSTTVVLRSCNLSTFTIGAPCCKACFLFNIIVITFIFIYLTNCKYSVIFLLISICILCSRHNPGSLSAENKPIKIESFYESSRTVFNLWCNISKTRLGFSSHLANIEKRIEIMTAHFWRTWSCLGLNFL